METSLRRYTAHPPQQTEQQQIYTSGTNSLSSTSQPFQYGSHSQHQAQDYMSGSSHYSRGSNGSSHNNSQVDEAYRRLGQRLSLRVHGDLPLSKPQVLPTIGMTPNSMFSSYDQNITSQQDLEVATGSRNRTAKVAKMRYSDHGDHHNIPSPNRNILRKMTMSATNIFRLLQSKDESTTSHSKDKKKRQLPTQSIPHSEQQQPNEDLSPQRFAFSQLALGGNEQHHIGTQQQQDQLAGRHEKHGLLSAVMESSSHLDNGSKTSLNSHGESSLNTQDTKSSLNSSTRATTLQGKCLTQPSTPVANKGLDNIDGNLVVHENDIIRISRKQIHVLTKDKMRDVTKADFRIQCLLGQGTFAQVFQCLHMQTRKLVAIKIVKNKPAYTRQATVEIDVFRALIKKQEKVASSSMSRKSLSTSPSNSTTDRTTAAGAAKRDYMVDLVCYFMYKSHLCLVFELLGLNLYEVLKRRQFRGLPLSVIQTLMRQAVGGISDLAKKSIVHCDLKPENILLVSDYDVNSVVSAKRSVLPLGKKLGCLSSSFEMEQLDSELTKAMKGSRLSSKTHYDSTSGLSKAMGDCHGAALSTADDSVDLISQSPTVNSLVTAGTNGMIQQRIKLIDFGSACFEGQTTHTYIQSRFYRSPEVLIGLPYDSAIDMWSLGCVAAELFLGLPILPGVHEYDQLGRITEMIADLPDWMIDQGSKASKYFVKHAPRPEEEERTQDPSSGEGSKISPSRRTLPKWRVRTQQEYIASLSQSEIRKKGGLAKLKKQPTNHYFKNRKLADIITHKGQSGQPEDTNVLDLFIHFLYGILDPDPWKRWTAYQAAQHPFVTGTSIGQRDNVSFSGESKNQNQANLIGDMYWEPPLDPGICRRKLLNVQKVRERQHSSRRRYSNIRPHNAGHTRHHSEGSYEGVHGRSTQESPSRIALPHQNKLQMNQVTTDPSIQPPTPTQLMSSSLVGYPSQNVVGGQFVGDGIDNISLPGSMDNSQAMLGPQSYSETVYSGVMQGSFADLDFAYALRRPGVVPMAESVSSSVDLNISLRQQYQQHEQYNQQQPPTGLYRTNLPYQYMKQPYGANPPTMLSSRSFGDSSVGTSPSSGQYIPQVPFGAQGGMGVHGNFMYNDTVLQNSMVQPLDTTLLQQMGSSHTDPNGSILNEGLYGNAQAYFQQQHAAFQQQQALLQQEQAALALQQQQLKAYDINQVLLNGNQSNLNGMNQFGQTGGGGAYYLASADGSIMNRAPYGMISPHGMAPLQQQQNVGGYPTNAGGNPMMNPPPPRTFHYRGGMSM